MPALNRITTPSSTTTPSRSDRRVTKAIESGLPPGPVRRGDDVDHQLSEPGLLPRRQLRKGGRRVVEAVEQPLPCAPALGGDHEHVDAAVVRVGLAHDETGLLEAVRG